VGYVDDFNLYAYVGNDPLNRGDPLGLCDTEVVGPEGESYAAPACDPGATLAASIETEAMVGEEGGGVGTGVFFNFDEDGITLGTFNSYREPGGAVPADIGGSLNLSGTGGHLEDFEGQSVTQELDLTPSLSRAPITPGLTLEAGRTSSGQPTGAIEFGGSTLGTSQGTNNVTITSSVTISGREVARDVQSLPERVQNALERMGFIVRPR